MAQIIDTKLVGLKTHANPLALQPGALLQATNMVCEEPDVVKSARGSKEFGAALAHEAKKFFAYQGRVLVHYETHLGYFSVDGVTLTDYTGAFTEPTGWRMKAVGANQNFYFTTSAGVYKLDSVSGTPKAAGGIKALDGVATITGSSGFCTQGNQVAYRIVWGIKDANSNVILGAPSQRIIGTNPTSTAASRDMSLVFTVPDGITTSHFYQIYRSALSGGEAIEPNDELQQVAEAAYVSGTTITVTDSTPDSMRGASLYTNSSQQGINQANEPPPMCVDMTTFRGMTLYLNTTARQRMFLNLLAVGSPNLFYYAPTANTHTSTTIDTISSMTGIAVGQLVTGSGVQAGTKVVTVNVGGSSVVVSLPTTTTLTGTVITFRDVLTIDSVDYYANASEIIGSRYFLAASGGSVSQNIENTARSLSTVVNRQAGGGIYAFYLSGYQDLPGKMVFEDRVLGGAVWAATSSKGSSFSPTLPVSGATIVSVADRYRNGVAVSKTDQPEAVPTTNLLKAGSADQDGYRILALRDSVFVLKSDGVYRITGDSPSSLQVSLFDNTAIIKGEETAVVLNNQIFCFSNQGVVAISDSGVQVLSRDIERDIKQYLSETFATTVPLMFGVAYESERTFQLWTAKNDDDTYPRQAWLYNTFTSAWTRWEGSYVHGFVNPADDKLYFAEQTATKQCRIERKTFTCEDYSMSEYPVVISAVSGLTVTVDDTSAAVIGQTLAQSFSGVFLRAIVTGIVDATHLTVDRVVAWDVAGGEDTCNLYDPLPQTIEWAPIHGGNPGIVKQFSEVTVFVREPTFASVQATFATNFVRDAVTFALTRHSTSEDAWGSGAWGPETRTWGIGIGYPIQAIRTLVPSNIQMGSWLNMSIVHSEALSCFQVCGHSTVAEPQSTRFK